MNSDFFGGFATQVDDKPIYSTRRKELLDAVKNGNAAVKNGLVVLFGALENNDDRFRQDKTFYYYTGINEPAAVLVMDLDGSSTMYIPNCYVKRAQWMSVPTDLVKRDAKALGVHAVEFLGDECHGYELDSYFSARDCAHLVELFENVLAQGGTVFTTLPAQGHEYVNTHFIMHRLHSFVPNLMESVVDISALVAQARRRKDMREIESIYRAVEITELAQEAALQAIKHGVVEAEVQASLEYIMIAAHARPAFPSIVASGKNSTILHYHDNNRAMHNGDLVLVDIGAEFNNYCADITRTYPVSGTFTKRQKEVYNIVLQTQEHVAECAKPGMWLRNNDKPEQSLHHIAKKFLASRGYDKYFPHGIGHFLGLNVHDVGNSNEPLQEGDVITIEPGIYISEENIGIRIEDNYWITKNGAVCLSENLPKDADDIEKFMQQSSQESEEEDEDDEWYDDEDEEDYN